MQNAKASLSLIYYLLCQDNSERRLIEHVDSVPITLLFKNEEGLEIEIDSSWHAVALKENYIIVNIGKALQIMSGGQYRAIKHRVNVPFSVERLSIASFVAPDKMRALKNYKTNTVVYKRFQDYLTDELYKVYPPTK